MTISLTGFMGCGKSSIGRKLSELLCCPFMDLDSVIEQHTGYSIPEIFASEGEERFREMELDTLQIILKGSCKESPTKILALGGGTVTTPECAELVKRKTLCIYLHTSAETLIQRLSGEASGRPLLNDVTDLRIRVESMLSRRSSTYRKTAHMIIDTDGKTIEDIALEIREMIF